MSGRDEEPLDPFRRGQRETEALKAALDDLREDVAAMVREEVARAERSRPDVEAAVREAVARERSRSSGPPPVWRTVGLVAVGAALGVFAGALGYRYVAVAPGEAEPLSPVREVAETAGEGAAASDPVGTPQESGRAPAPGPEELAALYDSLLAARSDRLAPLVGRLEAAGPAAPVSEAIAAWRSGAALDAGARRRLHDALVQLALNEVAGAGLVLDGLLARDPCGGSSCGALLALWRERGDELGMPPLPEDAARDTETLALAERVLVLRATEDGGAAP